jgi:hypothetical protein
LARTPNTPAAAMAAGQGLLRPSAEIGLCGPGGWARVEWVGWDAGRALGLGPDGKDKVLFFSEFISNAKNNPRKNCKLF